MKVLLVILFLLAIRPVQAQADAVSLETRTSIGMSRGSELSVPNALAVIPELSLVYRPGSFAFAVTGTLIASHRSDLGLWLLGPELRYYTTIAQGWHNESKLTLESFVRGQLQRVWRTQSPGPSVTGRGTALSYGAGIEFRVESPRVPWLVVGLSLGLSGRHLELRKDTDEFSHGAFYAGEFGYSLGGRF